jgi:thioredoxin reductase (NADPH)
MVKQAEKYQADLKFGNEVIDIQLKGKQKKIVTREGTYHGNVLILATGTHSKKLRIPGETDFLGLGVSYCPVCDGPLYRGLQVAVIGSGSEAFEDAFFMAAFAQQVFLITHSTDVIAEQKFVEEAGKKPNIHLVSGELLEIKGEQVVTGVRYLDYQDESEKELDLDGVFVSLGGVPLTDLVKNAGINLDKRGCIMVDRRQATNVDGVYAAGDCTCGGMQVITAAGEGAMAGIQAYRFTKKAD